MNLDRLHSSDRSGFRSALRALLEVLGMIPVREPAYARRIIALLLFSTLVLSGTGCGLPPKWHALANKLPEATPDDPAYQMLCVWEEAEGIGPDKLPTRGFAGKITFFTRKQDTGVRVNGDVRIYVYDDQGPLEERGKPLHQWDFLGDAWAIHLQDSSLGPSYSVFIPYSRKGSHQALCALRVRFTPEQGSPLYSDTVAVLLPGRVKERKDDGPLSGASHPDKRPSLESITIPLKEKRKTDWADRPLGQTEILRTVAPVSELPEKHPVPYGKELLLNEDAAPGRSSAVMATLPMAPPSAHPHPMPGANTPAPTQSPTPRPLIEDHSAQSLSPANRRTDTRSAPSAAPIHPLLGNSSTLDEGSNPFER